MRPGRRAVLAGGLSLAATPAWSTGGAPRATAPAGTFLGTSEAGVAAFRGIRYGRARRFLPPSPEPRGAGPVRSDRFGPACPQPGGRYAPHSEDCLFLNIWTPEPRPGARLPVLVYFHGGGYATGSVTDPLNDGAALATRGAVVVTVNHRLNALGYLYLAPTDPRFPDSGNTGQLDLLLSLRWIGANIAAFGGDPARVTLFGQSGGGAKIATLLGTPAASGLFHRAWTMSGQQVTASGPLHAAARARALLARLPRGADPVAVPAQALVDALSAEDPYLGGGLYMGPVLDMRTLTRHPFWPDAHPAGRRVPLVLGNTRDEVRGFVPLSRLAGLTWADLPSRLAPEMKVDIDPNWVVAAYRRREPRWSPADVFYAAATAARSWRGQVEEAEARAAAGAPAWVYQLDFGSRIDPVRGAFHTMDIPLAFGTLGAPGSETGTGSDARAASAALQDGLLALTLRGDPVARGRPAWPRYELPRRATMILDQRPRIEDDPRGWQRELFARVPYVQPGT